MTDNIVARLRSGFLSPTCALDAADEITRLRTDLAAERELRVLSNRRMDNAEAERDAARAELDRVRMWNTMAYGFSHPEIRKTEKDERIERLESDLAAANARASKYQSIAAELSDKLNGTPCAEIRWQQERDELRELLKEALFYVDDYARSCRSDAAAGTCARIDAALKGDASE